MADTSSSAPSSPTNRNFNEAFLSPPRNTFKSRPKSHPSVPRRPASAPPQRTSFSLDIPEDPTQALFERRRLSSFAITNTRGGELVRPPPPLCEYFYSNNCQPLIDKHSSAYNILAKDKTLRRNRCILFPFFTSYSTVDFHCRWP
jgi:hypothetical protein